MKFGDGCIVNGIVFCTDHGNEYCNECCNDHRPMNNITLNLNDTTTSRLIETCGNTNKRPPLNAYRLGATVVYRDGEEETFKCTKHGSVDCRECFDWNKWILESADMVEQLKAAVNPLTPVDFPQAAARS